MCRHTVLQATHMQPYTQCQLSFNNIVHCCIVSPVIHMML